MIIILDSPISKALHDAQEAAVAEERKRSKSQHPKHYTRNSARSQRRHAQNRKTLAGTGQSSIAKWVESLKLKTPVREARGEPNAEDLQGSSDESHTNPREEESESGCSDSQTPSGQPNLPPNVPVSGITQELKNRIQELLNDLRSNKRPVDDTEVTAGEESLNKLDYTDFPTLRRAHARLTVKSKDPKLDVVFRSRVCAMVGALNLYLDPELSYTWRDASLIAAKSQGFGVYRARAIRTWLHSFLRTGKLPLCLAGRYNSSILNDEDIVEGIQLHLVEIAKNGYIRAQDIVDHVATPEVQRELGSKSRGITVRTAQRWLKTMGWCYGKKKKGMYIDGHEWKDVVEYCKGFVERWKGYEKRMVTYDNDGNTSKLPPGFEVPQTGRFRLILVTHDESTFYAHNR